MRRCHKIILDADMIRYRSDENCIWDLDLSTVRLIGESTNQNGPFADDYFFCFCTGPDHWYEASFYATGLDQFLHDISNQLGVKIQPGLCGSTDFNSRVLWPPALAGEPMFTYVFKRLPGVFGRLFNSGRVEQKPTDAVIKVLTVSSK